MENSERVFVRQKLAAYEKISLCETELIIDQIDDDFINKLATVILKGYVYENTKEIRNLSYTFKRPTFLDWILRRKRNVTVKVEVKDLLNDPPKDCTRIAIVNFNK